AVDVVLPEHAGAVVAARVRGPGDPEGAFLAQGPFVLAHGRRALAVAVLPEPVRARELDAAEGVGAAPGRAPEQEQAMAVERAERVLGREAAAGEAEIVVRAPG